MNTTTETPRHRVGIVITDQNERQGILVSFGRNRGSVWVRPLSAPSLIETANGVINTATHWQFGPNGTLRGQWYDSPVGSFVYATLGESFTGNIAKGAHII